MASWLLAKGTRRLARRVWVARLSKCRLYDLRGGHLSFNEVFLLQTHSLCRAHRLKRGISSTLPWSRNCNFSILCPRIIRPHLVKLSCYTVILIKSKSSQSIKIPRKYKKFYKCWTNGSPPQVTLMSCGCRVNWSFLLLWPSRRTLYISPPLAARGIRQNWSLFIGKSPKIVKSPQKSD